MELFKNANFDFLGKQRIFIGLSVVLLIAGLASLAIKGGPRYGIDFKGGTVTNIRFATAPDEDKIRKALSAKIPGEVNVQPVVGTNEVIVETELRSEGELEQARRTMMDTLQSTFGAKDGKPDFHGMGVDALVDRVQEPLQRANVAMSTEQLRALARSITEYRDTPPRSGLIKSFDELSAVQGVTPAIINVLKQELGLGPFVVRNFELVGPKIGNELRSQAIYATLLALAGMLVYIAFRFETIYGVAAVVAVFHDTLITIGLFSIFNKEINLTVVAALLTLVGYSMNDTIVVFDRIRENLKTMRKESFPNLVNISINQTLSRTILTSGLTFLTVVALWLFGGPVLNPFSFALVVGIIVGTYSSIFIASPILIYGQNLLESRKRSAVASAPASREVSRETVRETGKKASPKAAK
ncbi:MAG: protein translocase subunit SecF [Bryobacterales bacterium]|nr:protein translocase subunit SecF [Bryobacterales bacterium]